MSRLSSDDWCALVAIARRSISSALIDKCLPDFPPFPAPLSEPRGAFVSLYCQGRLRGCVGQVGNPGALGDVVARVAISAAMHDPRFQPVRAEEVSLLQIEISVLTVPERIAPGAVIAGQHGLLVERRSSRGLLLPQVAEERKWSSQRLLEETCVKAGLPRDAWRDPATKIYGFTAEIFSEQRETGSRDR